MLASGYSGMGEALLVSVFCYILAFVWLPPYSEDIGDLLALAQGAGRGVSTGLGKRTTARSRGLSGMSSGAEDAEEQGGGAVHTTFGSTALGVFGMLGARTGLMSDIDAGPCFSLVVCSWLFDMAWAAYYDPVPAKEQVRIAIEAAHRRFEKELDEKRKQDGTQDQPRPPNPYEFNPATKRGPWTQSAFGVLPEIPHGFQLDRFVFGAWTDTVALVMRRGTRVVVAFRGTASRRNVTTDLNVSQEPARLGHAHNAAGGPNGGDTSSE